MIVAGLFGIIPGIMWSCVLVWILLTLPRDFVFRLIFATFCHCLLRTVVAIRTLCCGDS